MHGQSERWPPPTWRASVYCSCAELAPHRTKIMNADLLVKWRILNLIPPRNKPPVVL